jgi:hypothetical protein
VTPLPSPQNMGSSRRPAILSGDTVDEIVAYARLTRCRPDRRRISRPASTEDGEPSVVTRILFCARRRGSVAMLNLVYAFPHEPSKHDHVLLEAVAFGPKRRKLSGFFTDG